MRCATTTRTLRTENRTFAGTAGVSRNNRALGFQPGFLDTETGRMEIACFAGGMPSPVHVLDGVPEAWVTARSETGRVTSVKGSVVSGFIRGGRFYTRRETAALLAG